MYTLVYVYIVPGACCSVSRFLAQLRIEGNEAITVTTISLYPVSSALRLALSHVLLTEKKKAVHVS